MNVGGVNWYFDILTLLRSFLALSTLIAISPGRPL